MVWSMGFKRWAVAINVLLSIIAISGGRKIFDHHNGLCAAPHPELSSLNLAKLRQYENLGGQVSSYSYLITLDGTSLTQHSNGLQKQLYHDSQSLPGLARTALRSIYVPTHVTPAEEGTRLWLDASPIQLQTAAARTFASEGGQQSWGSQPHGNCHTEACQRCVNYTGSNSLANLHQHIDVIHVQSTSANLTRNS